MSVGRFFCWIVFFGGFDGISRVFQGVARLLVFHGVVLRMTCFLRGISIGLFVLC